ncbi:MAG: hypothetical protein OHK0028_17320 [Deltaproteobacteria bacterium]
MRVRIDGNEVSMDLSRCGSLGGALEEIYRKVAETGRVAGRVEIDGQELTNRAERELADRTLESVAEISLSTGTAAELLRSGLQGALSLADAIGKDIARTVESFRSGDAERGRSLYAACVEAMGTFFQMAGGILNGIRGGYFEVSAGVTAGAEAPSAETAELLERLLDHQKREDWIAMADVLEFEVAPNLDTWVRFLGALAGDQAK